MPSHYFRLTQHRMVERRRCALLERLLARADVSAAVTDWRADAFRTIAPPSTPMPRVAAAALFGDRGRVEGASVFLATPVQYLAEMNDVRLPADGILSLGRSEAEALALDFNRVWSDAAVRLLTGQSPDLYCVFDQPMEAETSDPEDVLDRHIAEHNPTGAAASRLRLLMSEIEMWLFEHAVNRARMAAGLPSLTGLWLWGGGPVLTSLPAVDGWAAGADPLFGAFAVNRESRPGAARAASGVVVTAAEPGTDEWRGVESRWLTPSLAELRAGRIERIDLSADGRCFSVGARWRWRAWRASRPWWEWFA